MSSGLVCYLGMGVGLLVVLNFSNLTIKLYAKTKSIRNSVLAHAVTACWHRRTTTTRFHAGGPRLYDGATATASR